VQKVGTAAPYLSGTAVPHSSAPDPVSATQHGRAYYSPFKITISHSKANMSSSLTPVQVAEQALREKAKLEAPVKYVQ